MKWSQTSAGALVALLIVGVTLAALHWRDRAADVERELEAERARAHGLVVAREATEQELERNVADIELLEQEIRRIREVAEARPTEVVRWRTGEIRVDTKPAFGVQVFASRQPAFGEHEFPSEPDVVDCPDLPEELVFEIRGAEARLESRCGNLFLAGAVELWMIDPPPPRKLGEAPFATEATRLERPSRAVRPPLRHALALGWSLDNRPVARYERALGRRWSAWTQVGEETSAGIEFRW